MMKRLTYVLMAGSAMLSLFSCDYVKAPLQGSGGGGGGGNGETRKILIEDYTGHRCGTCPPAAVQANSIASQYPDQVIILSIHAGFLSSPQGSYTNDFRTTIGDTWFTDFGFIATPSGMVNRWGYPTSAHNLSWGSWSSYADTMTAESAWATLEFDKTYNTSTRNVTGTVKMKVHKSLTGLHHIVLVLMQDSIIGLQLDNSQTPPDLPNYVHRHVLRDGLNGAWGDSICGSVSPGDSLYYGFNYTIQNTYGNIPCDDNKCHLVAFVYDANPSSPTYRQVIQAEEVKVK